MERATIRGRYFVQGVSCRVGEQAIPVVNLSRGGFFVTTDSLPHPDEKLDVELQLPEGRRVGLEGCVRWVNEAGAAAGGGLPRGFGAQIVRIDEPDESALRAFLRRADPVRGPAASW